METGFKLVERIQDIAPKEKSVSEAIILLARQFTELEIGDKTINAPF